MATKSSLPVLQHRDAFGARNRARSRPARRGAWQRHGPHRGRSRSRWFRPAFEAERRGGVADPDDELAARLDVVEPVGRGRLAERQQHDGQRGQDTISSGCFMTSPPRIRAESMSWRPQRNKHGGRPERRQTRRISRINLPLGLTFYCSALSGGACRLVSR